MAPRIRVERKTNLRAIFRDISDDIARGATGAMSEVTAGLKAELREQVQAAGLGGKVGNTWRGVTYPVGGRASLSPAAFVFSKAPKIVDAFERAPTIRTINGKKYLAIPTANVPRLGTRGHPRMTPAEVETAFNQDLKFARTGNGRLIAYVDAGGSASGVRRLSGKQLGRLYRSKGKESPMRHVQVVMFILTPTAKMPKRLNVDEAAAHWADQVPSILERRLGDAR
jgi:hypothetical protein